MILFHPHFHSLWNKLNLKGLFLLQTNAHCCDWLTSSYCIHAILYSMLCVLILKTANTVIFWSDVRCIVTYKLLLQYFMTEAACEQHSEDWKRLTLGQSMHPMFNQRRKFSTFPHVFKKLQTSFHIITNLFLKNNDTQGDKINKCPFLHPDKWTKYKRSNNYNILYKVCTYYNVWEFVVWSISSI